MSNLKRCSNCGVKPAYTSNSVAVCDNIRCTGRNMVERWNDRPIEDELHGKIDEMDDVIANMGHDKDALQAEIDRLQTLPIAILKAMITGAELTGDANRVLAFEQALDQVEQSIKDPS